ncbi:pksN, partial [Symbiodinium sp. CCMP2456]
EQLHGIRIGYTAQAGADDRTRHRMIGNGWHWGVAGRILGFVVLAAWAASLAEAGRLPATPKTSTLQWLTQAWAGRFWDFAPAWSSTGPRHLSCSTPSPDARRWSPPFRRSLTSDGGGDMTFAAFVGRSSRSSSFWWRPFQGPTFLGLLRDLGYPATADLEEDLRLGFEYAGPREPTYVAAKCSRGRAGVHTAALLEELVQEARLGRVTGPCAAPDHWS